MLNSNSLQTRAFKYKTDIKALFPSFLLKHNIHTKKGTYFKCADASSQMNTLCGPSQLRYVSAPRKPSHALPSGKTTCRLSSAPGNHIPRSDRVNQLNPQLTCVCVFFPKVNHALCFSQPTGPAGAAARSGWDDSSTREVGPPLLQRAPGLCPGMRSPYLLGVDALLSECVQMPAEMVLPWLLTGFAAEFMLKLLASFPSLPVTLSCVGSLGAEPAALHGVAGGRACTL